MWTFVCGLALVLAGGWSTYRGWRLSRTGTRTRGDVVDLHWRHDRNDRAKVCYPVVEFRTVDGQVNRVQTRVGRSSPIAEPGEQVPLIYDPENPENVEIDTWAGRGAWVPVAVTLAGLGLLVWAGYGQV